MALGPEHWVRRGSGWNPPPQKWQNTWRTHRHLRAVMWVMALKWWIAVRLVNDASSRKQGTSMFPPKKILSGLLCVTPVTTISILSIFLFWDTQNFTNVVSGELTSYSRAPPADLTYNFSSTLERKKQTQGEHCSERYMMHEICSLQLKHKVSLQDIKQKPVLTLAPIVTHQSFFLSKSSLVWWTVPHKSLDDTGVQGPFTVSRLLQSPGTIAQRMWSHHHLRRLTV